MNTGQKPAALLRLANIETLYEDRITVLRGLSLEIQKGEIFSLIGPNGAGKTTLLKTVAGLLKDQPKKGTIEFEGRQIQRRMPESIASHGVVYVPEDRGLFRELTVNENLNLACWGNNRKETRDGLGIVYDLFPILKEKGVQQAENLSGGQQQMLAVARALLRRPKLLMIDEPSLGLAPLVAKEVYEALHRISQKGTTILLVEQNAVLALGIAHYCYVMEGGRIVLKGPPADLRDNEDFKQLYLGVGQRDDPEGGWKLYRKRRTW